MKLEYMENGNILLENAVMPGNLEKLFRPVLWRKHLFPNSVTAPKESFTQGRENN